MTIDETSDTCDVLRETEHKTYPTVPEWVNLSNLSGRANDLMWQNSELINQAADLLNSGDMSPLAWEQLQDIWAESIELEGRFAQERLAGDL